MKIHTTQNLSSLGRLRTTNNSTIPSDEIRLNYSKQMRMQKVLSDNNKYKSSSVSFMGKLPKNSENTKKVVDMAKKTVGDIKKKAEPEKKWGDNFIMSSFFNAALRLTSSENVFSAATAAIICIILRPLTILSLPTKDSKNKIKNVDKQSQQTKNSVTHDKAETDSKTNTAFKGKNVSFKANDKPRSVEKTNNIYACAQSIASGIAGLVAAIILTIPFKKGQDFVLNNLHKFLSAEKIQKLYPWVEKASLFGKDGKIQEMSKWLDKNTGLKFKADIKNCDMLPQFKKLADVSKETFEKILHVDVDFAAQKGKSFNDVITKDGKSLYDTIDFNRLGIVVKEDGFKDTQILLRDIDRNYLEKVIADSKGVNSFGDLDINSVYENGMVKDFRSWKNLEGKNWKLDLDSINVSSELETAEYRPRTSGLKRFDKKDQEWKFVAYQQNGIDGKLGSPITNEMVEAEANNVGLIKCLTWLPDIAFRIPVATGTIALIPWVLKNIFHISKVKPNETSQNNSAQLNNEVKTEKPAEENIAKAEQVSFKGKSSTDNNISFKGNEKDPSWLTKFLAKKYGKPLLESEKMRKFSKWLTTIPGDVSEHMVVLGSLIQSSVYINRTLSNKELDEDRKKTLAVNQFFCFLIPTIVGYVVNGALNNRIKKIGYRYTGKMKQTIADLYAAGDAKSVAQAKELSKNLGKNIKGVGTLARLASFTLIYRYLTPVAVTPLANKLGDKYFSKKPEEQQKA